jgi:hypothetical protein
MDNEHLYSKPMDTVYLLSREVKYFINSLLMGTLSFQEYSISALWGFPIFQGTRCIYTGEDAPCYIFLRGTQLVSTTIYRWVHSSSTDTAYLHIWLV